MILAVCLLYCLCISLILGDRLFYFMSISKYSSSTGGAVGLTVKLWPTRMCVRLEYSHQSSIDDEIGYICIVWYFKRSLLVSRAPGSGQARRLARSACWSITVERRGVHLYGDRRMYSMSMQKEIWMSSVPTKVRPLERAGQVSVRWETGETYSHIERTRQLERGRRLTNETESGISGDPWSPLAYVVRRQRTWRGRTGLPESGWIASRSK